MSEKYFGIVQGPLDPNKLKSCSYWFRREIRVEQNLDGMYIRHVVYEIRADQKLKPTCILIFVSVQKPCPEITHLR